MARKLSGSTDQEKLADLASRPYKEQAQWFMNAFWNQVFEGNDEPEKVWAYKHKHDELDLENKVCPSLHLLSLIPGRSKVTL